MESTIPGPPSPEPPGIFSAFHNLWSEYLSGVKGHVVQDQEVMICEGTELLDVLQDLSGSGEVRPGSSGWRRFRHELERLLQGLEPEKAVGMGLVLIRLLTILPVTSSRGYTDAIIKIYQHSGVINGLLNQVEQGPTHQQGATRALGQLGVAVRVFFGLPVETLRLKSRVLLALLKAFVPLQERFPNAYEEWLPAAIDFSLSLVNQNEADQALAAKLLLALNLPSFEAHAAMLERLFVLQSWPSARDLINTIRASPPNEQVGRDLAIRMVTAIREQGKDLKRAHLLTKEWELREVFPDSYEIFKKQDIRNKVRQNKWGIAFGLLPQRDTDFYLRYLISEMIDFGQCIAADKLIKKYDVAGVEVPRELIAEQKKRLAETCLRLPFGMDRVLVVDSHDTLNKAREWITAETGQEASGSSPLQVYGIDTEWSAFMNKTDGEPKEGNVGEDGSGGPLVKEVWSEASAEAMKGDVGEGQERASSVEIVEDEENGNDEKVTATAPGSEEGQPLPSQTTTTNNKGSQKAAIFQLALRSCVLIFDLLALTADGTLQDEFSSVIADIFTDPNSLKAGFGIAEDLSMLHKSWPDVTGFSVVEGVLDLAKVSASLKKCTGGKLSDLAEMWLGRPLDKTEQTSEWETRPLDPEQVLYAALDASVCVSIFDAMAAFVESRQVSPEQKALLGNKPFYAKYVNKIIMVNGGVAGKGKGSSGKGKRNRNRGRGRGRGGRGRSTAGRNGSGRNELVVG